MKTFEEKWTAWLDDQLSGRELSEFEGSLPDKAAAQAEKAEARKLGELLKRELTAHPLTNEEFFSHQTSVRSTHCQRGILSATHVRCPEHVLRRRRHLVQNPEFERRRLVRFAAQLA